MRLATEVAPEGPRCAPPQNPPTRVTQNHSPVGIPLASGLGSPRRRTWWPQALQARF
jgi:hypothetical protein